MAYNIDTVLQQLKQSGGDTSAIEVKSAAGGLPTSLPSTLSAMANLPGGGLIVLGLMEEDDFKSVGLPNPHVLKQGVGKMARDCTPPVQLNISDAQVDGSTVVVVEVMECDPADKPCMARDGRAYRRSYDGDFALSDLERQGFLASRSAPKSDILEVEGTSLQDLDTDLLEAWRSVIDQRGHGLSRFQGDEQLRRAGVLAASGALTVAGLLTFGIYPQQYFPRLVIHAANKTTASDDVRAKDLASITGPIPSMLAEAMTWLRANVPTRISVSSDGSLRDGFDYPMVALRELVANALVHRELGAWAQGSAIEMRLEPDRFVIANPGGLYGVSVDRLGSQHVTSARNARLVHLNVDAREPISQQRVVEALADGIPTVVRLAAQWGLPPVIFQDEGIAFRAVMKLPPVTPHPSGPEAPRQSGNRRIPRAGSITRAVYEDVQMHGPSTVKDVAERLGSDTATEGTIRSALTRLREEPYKLIRSTGGPGRATTYHVLPDNPV